MKNASIKFSLMVIALLALTLSSGASVLPPGNYAPVLLNLPSSFSFVQSAVWQPYSTGDAGGLYTAYVIRDNSTGYLDFIYGFSNDASNAGHIDAMTVSNFSGFVTALGYGTYCCPFGSVLPSNIGLSNSGTVSFQFLPQVEAGEGSVWLQINTDAYNYTTGGISFIDNNVVHASFFAPAAGVPEPTSLVLFGSGLLGLGNFVRRKFIS